jgi:cytochrome c5
MERKINMHLKHFLPSIAIVASISALALPAAHNDKTAKKPVAATHGSAQTAPLSDDGDRIFQQNCSRCHNAPEGFSPRISGTIVRHMRVRASLSQHDAEELLRFFNP